MCGYVVVVWTYLTLFDIEGRREHGQTLVIHKTKQNIRESYVGKNNMRSDLCKTEQLKFDSNEITKTLSYVM